MRGDSAGRRLIETGKFKIGDGNVMLRAATTMRPSSLLLAQASFTKPHVPIIAGGSASSFATAAIAGVARTNAPTRNRCVLFHMPFPNFLLAG